MAELNELNRPFTTTPESAILTLFVLTQKEAAAAALSDGEGEENIGYDGTPMPICAWDFFLINREVFMETRVAMIGIIVENQESADEINRILHRYGEYIIGRMGVPYREKGISIISIVIDAPMNVISSISGKLGMLPGVSSKAIYSKANEVRTEREDLKS